MATTAMVEGHHRHHLDQHLAQLQAHLELQLEQHE
jgi:hypothetical protein